jgi:hypothetical protein
MSWAVDELAVDEMAGDELTLHPTHTVRFRRLEPTQVKDLSGAPL